MTSETKNRIEAYQRALPNLRERVVAVALLLAMSVSMLASASFAWITLATAPEATGMQTTVAANGNLEIALAQGQVSHGRVEPAESAVGDSSASDQNVVRANATWGNLVNVSDSSYGLSHIALRPALLSSYNLEKYPLYGATYGSDGRVVSTTDRYEYASWKNFAADDSESEYRFGAGSDVNYGVRAIASVAYENVTGNLTVTQFDAAVTNAYYEAASIYAGMIATDSTATKLYAGNNNEYSSTCISALESLVSVFAQDKVNAVLNSETKTSCSPYLYYFYQMLLEFEKALDAEGEALLNMANWQAYSNSADGATNTFKDIEDLKNQVNSLSTYDVTLTTLQDHITDYNNLQKAIKAIEPMAMECKDPNNTSNPAYYWADIYPAVSYLVNINTATLDGYALGSVGGSTLVSIVTGGGNHTVILKDGVLTNFEQRVIDADSRMAAPVTVTVKVIVSVGVNATVYTKASGAASKSVDLEKTASGGVSGDGEAVAKDTYGMALDLWVRTNDSNAVLTLEGSIIYEEQNVTTTLSDGAVVDVYTITVNEIELDVYQKNGTWYYLSGEEVAETDIGTPKQKTVEVAVGYQGDNRIWENWEDLVDSGYIQKDSTTQGSGSCFVFYADTPAEQAKMLEMLDAFTIAFVDDEGHTLGTAGLNTDHAIYNQGKVTVPLEITSGTSYKDEAGNTRFGITALNQNEATWITAIVYLNGMRLENENVLAEGELQGQLNIQFGTNTSLSVANDEELQSQYRTITASVSCGGKTSTNGTNPIELEYSPDGYKVTATLTVEGEQPQKISGYFVRVISSTQGSKGETVDFTKQSDGTWTAEFTLTNPGTYVMSTLLVDGVQYDLHDGSDDSFAANHPTVIIDGLTVNSVTTSVSTGTYMTTDTSYPVTVTADITAAAGTPKQVNAQFFSEDDSEQFTALLSYDSSSQKWVGSTNITSSGTYTLKYISVDGQVLEVPAQNQTRLTLYLGLRASVYTTTQETFELSGDEPANMEMYVLVRDGSGEVLTNLSDVTLYYHLDTSQMDKDGLTALLTWNGQYYHGQFEVSKEGIYDFARLTAKNAGNTSTLNQVDVAPTFTVTTAASPEYYSASVPAYYQLAINGNATATVGLKNAAVNASVTAEFTRTVGTETYLETLTGTKSTSTSSDVTNYTFDLNADGVWTMNSVTVTKNGKDFEFELDTDEVSTDVIKTTLVSVSYDGTVRTTNFTDKFQGTFLESKSSKPLTVTVTDYRGRTFSELGFDDPTVQWNVEYDSTNMKSYGNYTANTTISMPANEITMISTDHKNFTGTATMQYAGDYTTASLVVTYPDGGTQNINVLPTFEYHTSSPTVTITSVTPTGTYSIDTSNSVDDGNAVSSNQQTESSGCGGSTTYYDWTYTTNGAHQSGYSSSITEDGKTAIVYFKCDHTDDSTYGVKKQTSAGDKDYHHYVYSDTETPAVTISLSDTGIIFTASGSTVTLNFEASSGDDVRMYTGYSSSYLGWGLGTQGSYYYTEDSNKTSTYSWTSETTCMRYIGSMTQGTSTNSAGWISRDANDTKNPAGTITADTLTVVYNGITYTFTIPPITINNPY